MAEMMMLIDPSRCTGCRGCQVACKQWNNLPAVATTFTGDYQNPPDFDGSTFTLVRYAEHPQDGFDVTWLMTHDKCRHCAEPACRDELPPGTVHIDGSGAVVFNDQARAELAHVRETCPFAVPGHDEQTGAIVKCRLCVDRTADGLEPACAKTCPTGAITGGELPAMMQAARNRCAQLKQHGRYPSEKVRLYPDEVFLSHVRWILLDDPDQHGLRGDF